MSSNSRWLALLLLPGLLLSAVPLRAQQTGTATLVGRVIDQGSRRPIAGVSVALGDSTVRAITDGQGRFSITSLPAGIRQFTFSLIGYASRTDTVRLRADVVQELEVTLAGEAIALDAITVSVHSGWLESSGFYEREQSNPGGTFLTREEIERKRPTRLTDALREIPGLRTYYLDAGRIHVRFNREGGGNLLAFDQDSDRSLAGCEPDIYLDGILYRETAGTGNELRVSNFDIVGIPEVEGVEAYTGPNAPLQYQNACGVILVWTRRGSAPGSVVAPARSASASGSGAATRGREMPAIEEGTLVRIMPRLGERVTGTVSLVDADSLVLGPLPRGSSYTILDIRRLQRDGGLAPSLERVRRGAKWGFVLGVVGVAFSAAIEEFKALGEDEQAISKNSPRRPATSIKIIGAGTVVGALLGGTLWRYRKWIDVPIR
ncbi:MAG: TonB-dependent receptor [Gemmatimonadota bacterium]|jgi:hypothetical protein